MAANQLEAVREDYYQITEAILDSFPRYRPPIDLFQFNENLMILSPYSRKGTRLSNEQVEEVHQLCREGDLFVSRADHHIYSEHIVKQLSLVLTDENLKSAEVADICVRGIGMRLTEFLSQPVKINFDLLYEDCMVITEYLWADPHRLKNFMRRLHAGEYSLAAHSANTLFIGLWLLYNTQDPSQLTRKEFDNAALGFLVHDLGMSKIPAVITSKSGFLKPEEKDKIVLHPLLGMKIMQKLDRTEDEIKAIVLQHHERLNGSGYPQRLTEKSIARLGRIAAVADSFSAMLQNRPYGPSKTPLEAAKVLATDTVGYDKSVTARLLTAYATKEF